MGCLLYTLVKREERVLEIPGRLWKSSPSSSLDSGSYIALEVIVMFLEGSA